MTSATASLPQTRGYSATKDHLLKRLKRIEGQVRGIEAVVGSGPGEMTVALAGLVGAERVAAIDPSDDYADAGVRAYPAPRFASGRPRRSRSAMTR